MVCQLLQTHTVQVIILFCASRFCCAVANRTSICARMSQDVDSGLCVGGGGAAAALPCISDVLFSSGAFAVTVTSLNFNDGKPVP